MSSGRAGGHACRPVRSPWYPQLDPALIVNLEPEVVPVNPYDWLQDPQHGGSLVSLLLGSNREDAAKEGMPSWCAGVALPAPQCPNDDPTSSVIDLIYIYLYTWLIRPNYCCPVANGCESEGDFLLFQLS